MRDTLCGLFALFTFAATPLSQVRQMGRMPNRIGANFGGVSYLAEQLLCSDTCCAGARPTWSLTDYHVRQVVSSVAVSPCLVPSSDSPLPSGVSDIFRVRPDKQMGRVAAGWIVACMAGITVSWNLDRVCKLIGDSVSLLRVKASGFDSAIAILAPAACPLPTGRADTDLSPKSVLKVLDSWHTYKNNIWYTKRLGHGSYYKLFAI